MRKKEIWERREGRSRKAVMRKKMKWKQREDEKLREREREIRRKVKRTHYERECENLIKKGMRGRERERERAKKWIIEEKLF